MKTPKRIQPLVDDGLVDEVLSRLMSGKEADVYVVRCGREIRCAKVYKEASKRNFKNAVEYTEGRKERNTRRARAIQKGSKFGRKEQEKSWQNAEVDALYLLANANIRVPEPYGCFDGVLLMELLTDADGNVAPRLGDVTMTQEQAIVNFAIIMQDIVRMLCVGVVHGDLSEFNVLLDEYGPVIIDLPQAVNAAANNNAQAILTRDIDNMVRYFSQFDPYLHDTNFPKEIWALYEDGKLKPDSILTGEFEEDDSIVADVDGVLVEIEAAFKEEQARQERIKERESE